MAISTVSELRSSVDRYMKRTLSDNQYNDFLDAVEARLWYGDEDPDYGCEPLRVDALETTSDVTFASGSASKPSDYLEGIRIYMSSGGTNTELSYYPPTDFWARTFAQDAGVPVGFTIEGSSLKTGDATTGTGKLLYYAQPSALDPSTSTSANTILTTNPNVYLWGVLAEANLFFKNFDTAAYYARRFRGAIGGWNGASRNTQAIGPLVSRPVAVA